MSIQLILFVDRAWCSRWINPIIIFLVVLGHACFLLPGFFDFQWQKKNSLEISIELSDGAVQASASRSRVSAESTTQAQSFEKKPVPSAAPSSSSEEGDVLAKKNIEAGMQAQQFNNQLGPSSGAPDQAAQVVKNAKPIYPMSALARRQEGIVYLNVEVLSDGTVGRVGVYRSTGASDLDQSAVTAVKKWQFSPAQLKGVGVAQVLRVPVRFSLNQVEAR
jgi:TonB family protein